MVSLAMDGVEIDNPELGKRVLPAMGIGIRFASRGHAVAFPNLKVRGNPYDEIKDVLEAIGKSLPTSVDYANKVFYAFAVLDGPFHTAQRYRDEGIEDKIVADVIKRCAATNADVLRSCWLVSLEMPKADPVEFTILENTRRPQSPQGCGHGTAQPLPPAWVGP